MAFVPLLMYGSSSDADVIVVLSWLLPRHVLLPEVLLVVLEFMQ